MIRTISCEAKRKGDKEVVMLAHIDLLPTIFPIFSSPSASTIPSILLVVIEYFHSSATVCCNNKNIIIP